MNIKRILLTGLILIVVTASLSIVSADNSVNVGGIDFNIPDGFSEEESMSQAMDGYLKNENITTDGTIPVDASSKVFIDESNIIAISVVEFDSAKDAKKAQNYDDKVNKGVLKNIDGKNGTVYKINGNYGFGYCNDKYYILIFVNDETLLESVV